MIDLNELTDRLWANKLAKGFNVTDVRLEFNFTYGELAEAFEAYHKGKDDVDEEIADVMLYVLSIARMLKVDPEMALRKKLAKNEARVYRTEGQGHTRIENDKEKL